MQIIHGISKKHDGNMALHTGDNAETVIRNRKIFLGGFGLNLERLVCLNQTHSSNIKIITSDDIGKGAFSNDDALNDSDAAITNCVGVILCIMTADCVPILLSDEEKGVVAVIHAGWRGTAANIASKTALIMMEDFGSHAGDIKAQILPSIGICCYEVGNETATLCGCAGQNSLDLKKLNASQLIKAGLKDAHIEISDKCTSCDNEEYFSYRAENGTVGRFMSFITVAEK